MGLNPSLADRDVRRDRAAVRFGREFVHHLKKVNESISSIASLDAAQGSMTVVGSASAVRDALRDQALCQAHASRCALDCLHLPLKVPLLLV